MPATTTLPLADKIFDLAMIATMVGVLAVTFAVLLAYVTWYLLTFGGCAPAPRWAYRLGRRIRSAWDIVLFVALFWIRQRRPRRPRRQ